MRLLDREPQFVKPGALPYVESMAPDPETGLPSIEPAMPEGYPPEVGSVDGWGPEDVEREPEIAADPGDEDPRMSTSINKEGGYDPDIWTGEPAPDLVNRRETELLAAMPNGHDIALPDREPADANDPEGDPE